ncbi:MAG: hypothetical protein ACP5VR_11615 [Acidimicrobiales bacterium]
MGEVRYAPPAVQQAEQQRAMYRPVERKVLREAARWEKKNRPALVEQARRLAMGLYHGRAIEARPYRLGLALSQGEVPWAETWARCSLDAYPWARPNPSRLPLSCWVATSQRLVGRLRSGAWAGWAWDGVDTYRADLSRGKEWVEVVGEGRQLTLFGPGVAPLAVALTWKIYGAMALLEHPGLGPLRVEMTPQKAPEAMLALPERDPLEDLLRGM